LEVVQFPWLLKDGDSAWYASTVPVGRSCARFAALDITLSVAVVPEELGAAIGTVRGSSAPLGVARGAAALACEGGIWMTMVAVGEDAMLTTRTKNLESCSVIWSNTPILRKIVASYIGESWMVEQFHGWRVDL
jgi:hypothetical protein